VNGKVLHFYLAGINNQNFLMRDRETGSWWQQITGKAIYGPLRGASLDLVQSDELTFGEWKSEVSDGKVLAPVAKYQKKYESNWEADVAKLPVVISFPGTELKSRDVVVGLELDGASRAYSWDTLVKQSPVVDRVRGVPLLIAVGPDGKSVRVFKSRIDGQDAEFFLKGETEPDAKSTPNAPKAAWALLDTATASEWNFQGCAISGPSQGKCLDRVPALKDYWFDWRNYHPDTTIYKR
jgi:hypothetical protein